MLQKDHPHITNILISLAEPHNEVVHPLLHKTKHPYPTNRLYSKIESSSLLAFSNQKIDFSQR